MALTKDEVTKIAHLARLALTDEEVADYQHQLSDILDYVAMLSELDLADLPPTAHAVAQQNVMRADVVVPSLSMDEVLHNAPQHAQNQFQIQTVLDDS
jgi:aspartyl-tRNA(Asn)/glutamyl-tRNA(Gln) amidotransferase subunit C